jgi:prephenate dehydrogenase
MLKAEMLNAFHEKLTAQNAKDLDMLILSVYPDYFEEAVEKFLPHLKKGAIVSDFSGVKGVIIDKMKEYKNLYPDLVFIGGHPMAGREFSGIDKSVSTLFDKASMILTNVNADIFVLEEVKKFYLSLGFSEVVITTPEYHDRAIAFTSQLCHIVSNAFIKNEIASEHFGYSAGSYKDLTRVARLNPDMWAELMSMNKDNLQVQLDELIGNLTKYSVALKQGDKAELKRLLAEGNDRKLLIDSRKK